MCGIAGVVGPVPPSPDAIARTLALMGRRGPDASASWSGTIGNSTITLLHTRLAIIDLDPRANQPFRADGCVLSCNGEFYNYLEVRRELEALGRQFATRSDTEVLLQAYREWGPACADRFEGMWALALYDERSQLLWLSRDRFGEKPLFTMMAGGALLFASEIKLLAALAETPLRVNVAQVKRFLVNGYKSLFKGTETFFNSVVPFPPGSSAWLREPAPPAAERYWTLDYEPRAMARKEVVARAGDLLSRATELSLRADVPVAFRLSGGVDSGALAALAVHRLGRDIATFSIIDSDERYDESANIGEVVRALGCRHTAVATSRKRFLERLAEQIDYHDAPVTTISYYIHDLLTEAIAAAGFKVAISGIAADELFTGYYDHYGFWLAAQAGSPGIDALIADWRQGMGAAVRNPYLKNPMVFAADPGERRHIYLDRDSFACLMTEPFDEDFAERRYTSDPLRNRMLNELFHESVPVMLHEDDLNSMRHSIENRSPFLNRALAEFMYAVPGEHLIEDGYTKSILRDAVAGMLPERVRCDRRKKGFNASIVSLMDPRDPATRERLLEPSSPIFDLVDRARFAALLDGDFSDNARSKFLFSFVSAQAFLDGDLARGRRAGPAPPWPASA